MSEKIEGETGRYDSDKLKDEIFKVIDYFRVEYRMTYAEVVGVLEIVKLGIYEEMLN